MSPSRIQELRERGGKHWRLFVILIIYYLLGERKILMWNDLRIKYKATYYSSTSIKRNLTHQKEPLMNIFFSFPFSSYRRITREWNARVRRRENVWRWGGACITQSISQRSFWICTCLHQASDPLSYHSPLDLPCQIPLASLLFFKHHQEVAEALRILHRRTSALLTLAESCILLTHMLLPHSRSLLQWYQLWSLSWTSTVK